MVCLARDCARARVLSSMIEILLTDFESQDAMHSSNVVTGGWDGRPVTDPT